MSLYKPLFSEHNSVYFANSQHPPADYNNAFCKVSAWEWGEGVDSSTPHPNKVLLMNFSNQNPRWRPSWMTPQAPSSASTHDIYLTLYSTSKAKAQFHNCLGRGKMTETLLMYTTCTFMETKLTNAVINI